MYYCAHSQPLPKKSQLPSTRKISQLPPPPKISQLSPKKILNHHPKISQPPKNMLTINPPAPPPHFTYALDDQLM